MKNQETKPETTAPLALALCSATIGVYVTLGGVRHHHRYTSRNAAAKGIRAMRMLGGREINVFDPWLPKTPSKPNR